MWRERHRENWGGGVGGVGVGVGKFLKGGISWGKREEGCAARVENVLGEGGYEKEAEEGARIWK